MAYLKREDFLGEYRISVTNLEREKTDEIINLYETKYLFSVFGSGMLSELYLTVPFGGVIPTTAEQEYILNPFFYEGLYSEGLKVALAKVIFMYLDRDQKINNSALGNRDTISEVSNNLSVAKTSVIHNSGINSLNAIQKHICANIELYPNYGGSSLRYVGIA